MLPVADTESPLRLALLIVLVVAIVAYGVLVAELFLALLLLLIVGVLILLYRGVRALERIADVVEADERREGATDGHPGADTGDDGADER